MKVGQLVEMMEKNVVGQRDLCLAVCLVVWMDFLKACSRVVLLAALMVVWRAVNLVAKLVNLWGRC